MKKVHKLVLDNGLTILVVPHTSIPKVSLQLWYNVGSKDERSGEKGLAHFIEHMIFKGTTTLSESDINMIVHKLSGYCNAFTSHDYTGYLFDMPSQHWQEIMPIMADSMRNCTFKEEFMNSELKAVIQELKMYNDDYASALVEAMITQIFPDHPYHHPIIGYKQDLWSLKRLNLIDFYARHYIPNNSTLVVVGDVEPEEVFKEAQIHFGPIAPDLEYKKPELYHSFDLMAQETTLYRDIQQPTLLLAWVIPGIKAKMDYVVDIFSWILGAGKGSRLSKILIDDLELASDVESSSYDLFDHSVFFIQIEPKNFADADRIIEIIQSELAKIAGEGIFDYEIHRARKKTQADLLSLLENNQKHAYLLGKYFVATGDEDYLQNYTIGHSDEVLAQAAQTLAADYFRPTVMYRGQVLPLPEGEQRYWLLKQEQSDREDARILDTITRTAEVEEAVHVHNITAKSPKKFNFLAPQTAVLPNGLKIIYCHNPEIPKIEAVLDFKYKHYYDPEDAQGLSLVTADVLQEGTAKYSGSELAYHIESHGMELTTFPGHLSLSMLHNDFETGLAIVQELVTQAQCTDQAVEKVKSNLEIELKSFWDTPSQFSSQILRELVYKQHPYHKNIIGSFESLKHITPEKVRALYKKTYTPVDARLVLVGDLSKYDTIGLVQKYLGNWQGQKIEDIDFGVVPTIQKEQVDYSINRDQIVLCYGGISVARKDPDFDALLLFDQIFTGGVLGSMSSRLFALRERSGLFYTIGGSLLAGVDVQPGMIYIKTIVSPDKLADAQTQITALIQEGASTLTQEELDEAKRALINSFVDNFASYKQAAATYLFLDKFGLGIDYFDTRPTILNKITVDQVKNTVAKYLSKDKLITLRVGRL